MGGYELLPSEACMSVSSSFSIIEDGRVHEIDARIGAEAESPTLRVAVAPMLDALGWTRKPEGLCQGEVCIPIRQRPDLIRDDGIDLKGLAEVLGRPLAIDLDERAASFGAPAAEHGSQLAQGMAPDFTLPDWTGKEHSLASFRGKKVLLIAYASW
jgi:hypothetical protein